MNPHKLQKWRCWLGEDPNEEATLQKELIDLLDNRRVFNGVRQMINDNPEIQQHSLFYTVFGENYADSVLMYLRRLAKKNPQGVSLIGLLEDLKQNSSMVTRQWYVDEFVSEPRNTPHGEMSVQNMQATFDRHFAGNIGGHLDPAVVESDINKLDNIHNACEDLINWRIAHLERRTPRSIPTFDDIDRWILEVKEVFWKYNLLLFGGDLQVEKVLTHDWQDIFRVPWVTG